MQTKEVIENRKNLCKEKNVTVDKKILENANDEKFNEALEQAQPKPERKAREVKVKHAAGSPHAVLTDFVNGLSAIQADYLLRHVIKKQLASTPEGMSEFEAEIYNGIKEKLA